MSDFVFSTSEAGATELYASDGAAAGTVDLGVDLISPPSDFTIFDGKLFFIGTEPRGTGPAGGSLEPVFSIDGTAAGTTALSPSGGVLYPQNLDVVGGKLLTSGVTFIPSPGIYASADGANFTRINATVAASQDGFAAANGIGIFQGVSAQGASLGLWRTDATMSGTYQLKVPGVTLDPANFMQAGRGLTVFSNQTAAGSTSLWVTNGTAAGTHAVAGVSINPGYSGASTGTKAIFTAVDASDNISVWSSDGSAAGTTEIEVNGPASEPIRTPDNFKSWGSKVLFSSRYDLYVTDGTRAGTVALGGGNPDEYVGLGSRVFIASLALGPASQLYVSDGSFAGTVLVHVPNLQSINGELAAVGNDVVFEGTDTSGREALFQSDGTAAGSKELTLPAGVAVDAATVIAPLPQTLRATLPSPLHTGVETVTGTGGVAGLQLERITTGTYNTPGSAGWVKATVQANGDWSAQLTFTKPGQLAHVYAENGGSTSVVDLVDGTPSAPPPPTKSFTGVLPSPLHAGAETVTGTGGIPGLRLERITQGAPNTPGQAGWVTAAVAADGTWSAQLRFTKPGMLAHVYAQNGGAGAVIDLVDGTPIAAAASSISGSIGADMTAKASIAAHAQPLQTAASDIADGWMMPLLGHAPAATPALPDHSRIVAHLVPLWT